MDYAKKGIVCNSMYIKSLIRAALKPPYWKSVYLKILCKMCTQSQWLGVMEQSIQVDNFGR
jgi:hypothetical protein